MAVKAKFYPILPREKRSKRNRVRQKTNLIPFKYDRVVRADWRLAHGAMINANHIDEQGSVHIGDSDKSYTNNSNWRQLVAKGVDAGSNYSRQIYSGTPLRYTCFSYNSTYESSGYGTLLREPTIQENSVTTLEDRALGRLKNKLNGHIGKAELAAPLAESREIHRLVRQINGLGMDMVKSLLAAKKTKGKSLLKQFGDVWLGFGFGVNPLLKDIENAANAILDYTTRQDHHVVITAAATQEYQTGFKDTASRGVIAYGMGHGFAVSANHKQGIRYVAGIDLTIRTSSSYGVTDHLGLEVGQLPAVLWELTPFSWVVDYAATVGPWLEDMFFTLPGNLKYLSKNYKYQSETNMQVILFQANGNGFTHRFSGGTSTSRYVNFGRTMLATLPTRALRFKTADEIANNGLTKLLNLGSVLAQKRGPKL